MNHRPDFKTTSHSSGIQCESNADINFQQALANAKQFSPIRYAATPKLRLSELSLISSFDYQNLLFTHSGGTALSKAGQVLKLDSNTILVPSYHCPAAIEPFIWLGFKCIFYRVNADLSPDKNHVHQLINQHDISHCLTINYFGVICHLPLIADILSSTNIIIIHDCAHALFDLLSYTKVHNEADATICSINKILPSIDGGIVTFKSSVPRPLQPVGFVEESKAILYLLGITSIINKLRFAFKKRTEPINGALDNTKATSLCYFNSSKAEQQCFSHTIAILRRSNLNKIAQRRRENYRYLCSALKNSGLGTLLKPQLDQHNVPYVLPFLLHDKSHFSKVRQTGIQCLRWEEIAQTDCNVSQDYRSRLLQLPCHHQLSKQELDAMIKQLKDIL